MLAGELDRVLGGLLPGFGAGADDLDHFVNTLRHERASLALKSIAPALVSRTRLAFSLSYADLKALSSPREGRGGDCQGHDLRAISSSIFARGQVPRPTLRGRFPAPHYLARLWRAMAETTELKAWARQRLGKGG